MAQQDAMDNILSCSGLLGGEGLTQQLSRE